MVKASKKVEKTEEPVKEPVESSESDSGLSDAELDGLPDAEDDRSHKVKKLNKKPAQKNQKDASQDEYSGIIFVSRLPHGFQEKELSKYFSQFGDLKNTRLARNKKTGNTRHYGFIEFVNKDDAKIAQETMNNYLLMGHLIQVRLLPKGSKIEKLYKYKHRSFQFAPVKKSTEELKERARKKHDERVSKLKEAGIDFKW